MKNTFWTSISQNRKLLTVLLTLDVVVILLHLLFGSTNSFFHVDFEQNFPTGYQSLKLMAFGLLFLVLTLTKKVEKKFVTFIFPLSLLLFIVGLDELLQIHENIYKIFEQFDVFHPSKIVTLSMNLGYRSSLWLLYYLPVIFVFIFWCGYWLHYFQSKMKRVFLLSAISSFCFFMVLLAEILSSTGSYTAEQYFWLVTIEEVSEMIFASTLITVGMKVISTKKTPTT